MKFNSLIPELSVSNLTTSLKFYVDDLGFQVAYKRVEDAFVFLQLGGAQLMLEERNGHWETGEMQKPFGRGANFQIQIEDPKALAARLTERGISLFRPVSQPIYETPDGKQKQTEFLVQDPDGYLLRFCD